MNYLCKVIFSSLLLSNMVYAADTTVAQLNTQIQAQLKTLQEQQQQQITTLNSQLQTQLQKLQTDLQTQIQTVNGQTQTQMKQMQTTLQQQIAQVQQDIKGAKQ